MSTIAHRAITVPATAGLHLRISKSEITGRWVASLFKEMRRRNGLIVGLDVDVMIYIADEQCRPRIARNYRGSLQVIFDAAFFDLPESSAKRAAEFLGIAFE